jgi:hypothetical protein
VEPGAGAAAAPLALPKLLLLLTPVRAPLLLVPKPRAGAGSGKGPDGMPNGGGAVAALRGDGPMLTDGAAAVAAEAETAEAELAALLAGIQEAAGWEAAAAAARVPKVMPLAPAKPGPAPAASGWPAGEFVPACWPPNSACCLLNSGCTAADCPNEVSVGTPPNTNCPSRGDAPNWYCLALAACRLQVPLFRK